MTWQAETLRLIIEVCRILAVHPTNIIHSVTIRTLFVIALVFLHLWKIYGWVFAIKGGCARHRLATFYLFTVKMGGISWPKNISLRTFFYFIIHLLKHVFLNKISGSSHYTQYSLLWFLAARFAMFVFFNIFEHFEQNYIEHRLSQFISTLLTEVSA